MEYGWSNVKVTCMGREVSFENTSDPNRQVGSIKLTKEEAELINTFSKTLPRIMIYRVPRKLKKKLKKHFVNEN